MSVLEKWQAEAGGLSTMFTERPFPECFEAAAIAGFEAVESCSPMPSGREIRARLGENGLIQALFNRPPGDFAVGERALACLAGRASAFRRSVAQALA